VTTISRRVCLSGLACSVAACGNVDAGQAKREAAVRPNLYQCEGCEGVFETGLKALTSSARIGPAGEPGEPLLLTGTVFQSDGKTPAAGVVIYAYQTNAKGLYANGTNASEWSRRHGRLRGWLKTGADGSYRFETIKPAPYPNENLPAHVHFTVLEPGRQPYWIDDIVFDGEFGVTPEYRRAMINQGGNGIVKLTRNSSGVLVARRDIVLERHAGPLETSK
jgi:protocatechuate 3,4-dioxygenase, beta subunit